MKEKMQSINNMIINAYYKDKEESSQDNDPFSLSFKRLTHRVLKIFYHIVCLPKYGVKKTINNLKAEINPQTIYDYYIKYDFDHDSEIHYEIKRDDISKVAVYTAVFGNYDSIKEPLYISDNCDYYAITDQNIPDKSAWVKYTIKDEGFEQLDNYHKAKYCKLHPHELFPQYEYSIWIDGNVRIVADVIPLIDRMSKETTMATFQNPYHRCIYTESRFLIYHNAANLDVLHTQVSMYQKEGFPKNFGMREFTIIVRKHNDRDLIDLMEKWWTQVNKYTMRDQISLPYLLWSRGYTIDYIQLLGENWRHNPRFIAENHSWRHYFKK